MFRENQEKKIKRIQFLNSPFQGKAWEKRKVESKGIKNIKIDEVIIMVIFVIGVVILVGWDLWVRVF